MALFWRVYLLDLYIVFIFSGFTPYIYCSSLSIILRVYLFIYLFILSVIHSFIHLFTHLFIYLFIYLLIYLLIYLFIYLLVPGSIRQKGKWSLFGSIFNPGMLRVEGVSSIKTYIYSSSIQSSRECLVINWMLNSRYVLYHL